VSPVSPTLRQFLAQAPGRLFIVDADYRIARASEANAAFYGVPVGDLEGCPFASLVGERFETRTRPALERCFEGLRVDYEHPDADARGEIRYTAVRMDPLRDASGAVTGALVACRDVTDARRAMAALIEARDAAEQAERASSAFMTTVSHEVRTPLNGVLGMADILRRQTLTPRQRHAVEMAGFAGRRVMALVDALLDLSQSQQSGVVPEIAPFAPAEVVRQAAAGVARVAAERRIDVETRVEGASGMCLGDARLAARALAVLAGAAITFRARACILIGARMTADDRLRLSVQDDGADIAPGAQPALIRQGHAGVPGDGSGAGLAFIRDSVAMLAGTMGVESAPRAGATFWFEFPASLRSQSLPAHTDARAS